MHFLLTTADGIKMDQEVVEVILPTKDGIIGVLDHHMPLFSVLSPGVIKVRQKKNDSDNDLVLYATYGGVVSVDNNQLNVLADMAELASDLVLEREQQALDLAKEMKKSAKDEVSIEKAQQLIDRQTVRLNVASLRRKKS